MTRGTSYRILALATALMVAAPLAAQSLADRIAAVGSGTVRLSFEAKDGVCGNGRGSISIDNGRERTYTTRNGSRAEWSNDCESGPVRVAMDVSRRQVTDIRSYVGGSWRGSADLDLGMVDAAEASRYFVGLAQRAEAKVAEDAVFASVIGNAPDPWRALLDIAKDDNRPQRVRRSATFWVAQAAGEAATQGLTEIVESDEDREVRKSAVFAISQRPADEAVPVLIRVARSNRDPEIRKSAIFWLGQSRDQRAIAYFEQVLLGK